LLGCTTAVLGALVGCTMLGLAQLVVAGCTTMFLGVLVCTELGTLQLLGCTTAVLGALAGCNTVGFAQLVDEGKRPADPIQFVVGFGPDRGPPPMLFG